MSREIAESSSFWKDSLAHQLLTREQLDQCFSDIPPEKQTSDKIDNRLARLAVHHGFITLWQAQRVLTRRASSLFIDKYLLLNTLGQGGMGRVFLARDRRLNRLVAIKVLNPDRATHERSLARFEREAQVGGQLQHENLVRIYDVGLFNNAPYLVMEYIEGLTVADLIARQGRLDVAQTARIGRDIALGLQHLAEKKMVHRDVNPRNILIDKEGRAKLTDLGLAIFEEQQAQVTNEGSTVGTFDYISPEQARHSHGVDIRSDLYSLGCSLYHTLSGQVPFPAGSLAEKIYSHQVRDPQPLENFVSGVPRELARIIQRCMKKKPEERFESARELAEKLSKWVKGDATPLPMDLSRTGSNELSSQTLQAPPGGSAMGQGGVEQELIDGKVATWHGDEASKQTPAGTSDPDAFQIDLGADSLELPRRFDPAWKSAESPIRLNGPGIRIALILIAATIFGILVLSLKKTERQHHQQVEQNNAARSGHAAGDTPSPNAKNTPSSAAKGIVVRFADGEEVPFDSLTEAVRRVNGQQAEILVEHAETPWVWAVADNTPVADARLHIRGRGEEPPRVILDLSQSSKGLVIRADSRLEITGIQWESRGQNAKTPFLQAFGDLSLERCRVLHRETQPSANVGLRINSRRFQMRDSWIHGFSTALEAQLLPESQVIVDNSLLTNHTPPAPAAKKKNTADTAPLLGIEIPKANIDHARVSLTHVTLVGQNLVALGGDLKGKTLAIDVSRSLFRGKSLLGIKPGSVGSLERLEWNGDRNLFDLTDEFTTGVIDGKKRINLKDWSAAHKETNSVERKVLLNNPASHSPTPLDFEPRQKSDQEFGYKRIGG